MIQINNLKKEFKQGKSNIQVLKNVDLEIQEGEFVAIMGPSGAGKSTLLQLLAGLDVPTEGEIIINNNYLHEMSERERTIFRRRNIGLVFQNYQLLPNLTVEENIAFPLHADGKSSKDKMYVITELLESVGLSDFENTKPNLLSGGQQQRVAIARALVNNPSVLLADEPTGNLDRNTAEDTLNLITKFNHQYNQTIIMVTHDIFSAGFADRILLFKDGEVDQSISRKEENYAKYMANFMA